MDLFGEADLAEAQGFDLMEEMRRRGGANLSQTNSPQAQAQHMAARQRQIQERALAQQAARRSSPFATGPSRRPGHGRTNTTLVSPKSVRCAAWSMRRN
ncbi:MAG: hypothetical protein EBT15_11305 [Betaproteobacteria bacterium]|nr:hypothetical protein [Betaproteobacteria bacterium]